QPAYGSVALQREVERLRRPQRARRGQVREAREVVGGRAVFGAHPVGVGGGRAQARVLEGRLVARNGRDLRQVAAARTPAALDLVQVAPAGVGRGLPLEVALRRCQRACGPVGVVGGGGRVRRGERARRGQVREAREVVGGRAVFGAHPVGVGGGR